MKKKLAVVAVALFFLAMPISNLIARAPANRLTRLETEDAELARVARILGTKCANCHTSEFRLPWYAKLPVLKDLIRKDVQTGLRYMDLVTAVIPEKGKPVAEAALAKIEHAVERGTMPPLEYRLLHWNGGLGAAEKADLLAWVQGIRAREYATGDAAPDLQHEPVQPLPLRVELDARKVALGRKLYHDPRLSVDGTVSCATCHDLARGGTDRLKLSKGVGGQVGNLNAPTTFNSGHRFAHGWDGRSPTLEAQARETVEDPITMGANWSDVIVALSDDADLVKAFAAAFRDGVTTENVVAAIAEFERSLITPNSRFDRYLRGKVEAITAAEKAGYRLFKKLACATCHVGELLGGQSFELMGRAEDYFRRRSNVAESDYGRYNVTKIEKDRYRFKVPTLRNIALTAPYFHDGSVKDLREAVRTMAACQSGVSLSEEEIDLLVQFLKTLTGEYESGERLQ